MYTCCQQVKIIVTMQVSEIDLHMTTGKDIPLRDFEIDLHNVLSAGKDLILSGIDSHTLSTGKDITMQASEIN